MNHSKDANAAIYLVFWRGFVFAGFLVVSCQPAFAQPELRSPFAGESLRRTRITLAVENQAVRQVLRQIIQSVNLGRERDPGGIDSAERPLALWFDRRIDPSQKVNVTAAQAPAAEVILSVIEPLGLVVYPLPGVLLIGRGDWVASTLASLPSPKLASKPPPNMNANREVIGGGANDQISVHWPTGAMAAEVLAMVVSGKEFAELTPDIIPNWMPHDVWAEGGFENVDRTLAAALVLAQFDLQLERTPSLLPLLHSRTLSNPPGNQSANRTESSDDSEAQSEMLLPPSVEPFNSADRRTKLASLSFSQAYPGGDVALKMREVLKTQKTRSSVRASGGDLLVRTAADNHVLALKTLWSVRPKATANREETNEPVFDLKLINKPVAEALSQFAAAAGKRIHFEPDTELASERLVSLDAVKKTLSQLANDVAGKVGLAITWGDKEVIVRNP